MSRYRNRPRGRPDPRTVRLQHLIEQADAATGHAAALFDALARDVGGTTREAVPGPIMATLLRRLVRENGGQPPGCVHISPHAPAPACWAPWSRLLRCIACHAAFYDEHIRGTVEEERCDHCRRCVRLTWGITVSVPAVVVDAGPDRLASAWPPILVEVHLCRGCRIADIPDQPPRMRGKVS